MGLALTPMVSHFCNKNYFLLLQSQEDFIFDLSGKYSDKQVPVQGRENRADCIKLSPFSSYAYGPSFLGVWWAVRSHEISEPGCRRINES